MYRVTCLYQGTTYVLHDPETDLLRVYDDQLETEDNKPGEFQFSVSYDHPYLDKIAGLASDIRVYDDEEEIFRGRPIDDGEDLYRMRTFKCEGELAFLYDSIQPRRELHGITPLEFFTLLVNEHNAQVKGTGDIDKTFRVGVVTVTDSNDSLFRYTNRETTYECIADKIIDRLGGHLRTRITGGVRYLDLLSDVDTNADQPIQLGENLMNYVKDTDYTQVATACIPLGASQEETEIEALDAYLTISDVNNGSDTIQLDEAVARYGFICKVVNFDNITVPANLLTAGKKWLTDGQYADMTLTLTAVDLHSLGRDVSPIRVNTKVRVISKPHGMNRYFEVTKRTYHLTKPESDTVEFGGTEKKSFTSSAHSKVSYAASHAEETARRKIDDVIAQEKENISNILNLATHGYVVLDPNDGPERILIMDTNSVDTAQKIWKWDMNGLGYSSTGINGPWSTAITMNGEISADFIVTGQLMASLIKVGKLMDVNGLNFWDMETGEFSLASTATIGGKTAEKIAEGAVDAQTQADIFNKLTNNAKVKGIWMKDGELFINADYIKSGQILSDYLKLYGLMEVYDQATGQTIGGYIGYGQGATPEGSTDGVMLSNTKNIDESGNMVPNTRYVIVTTKGARMTAGGQSFYVLDDDSGGDAHLDATGDFILNVGGIQVKDGESYRDALSDDLDICGNTVVVKNGFVTGFTQGKEFDELKSEVGDLKNDVSGLDSSVNDINSTISSLQSRIESLENADRTAVFG